jgi:beta-glucanase (GH16 family)
MKNILFIFSIGFYSIVQAQTPQIVLEYAYQLKLNTALSDEFNGTSLNTNLWVACKDTEHNVYYPENVSVNNGSLKINFTDRFHTGAIESKNYYYRYGYYETRYKLPYYTDSNGVKTSKGLSMAFWTFFDKARYSLNPMIHDEIDFFEGFSLDRPNDTGNTTLFNNGIHVLEKPSLWGDPGGWNNMKSIGVDPQWYYPTGDTGDVDYINNYHTYGVLYLPNLLKCFVDGVEVYTTKVEEIDIIKRLYHPQILRFDGQLSTDKNFDIAIMNGIKDTGGDWPNNRPWTTNPVFEIDYFRYYEYSKVIPNMLETVNLKTLFDTNFSSNNELNGVDRNDIVITGNYTLDNHTLYNPPQTNGTGEFTVDVLYDPFDITKNYLIRTSGKTRIYQPTGSSNKFIVPRGSNLQIVPTPSNPSTIINPYRHNSHPIEIQKNTPINQENICKIELYPNPTKDILYFKGKDLENATIEIYSIDGKIIISNCNISNSINIGNLSKGIYIYIIKKEEYNKKGKLIIE